MNATQVLFMEQLLKTLHMTLDGRDIQGMEIVFAQGASMARRIIEGKEGPLTDLKVEQGLKH